MKSKHLIRIVFIALTLLLAFCTPGLMKRGFPQTPSQASQAGSPKYALLEYSSL